MPVGPNPQLWTVAANRPVTFSKPMTHAKVAPQPTMMMSCSVKTTVRWSSIWAARRER